MLVSLFLPWTQNISSKGYVTTRYPQQRPQAIQAIIAGRIDKWYVKEGDFVHMGDTIVYISEIKSEYFDPDILERTTEQLSAKTLSVKAYEEKIDALKKQYSTLQDALNLKKEQIQNKIAQAHNKIRIDSIDLMAFKNNFEITKNQFDRTKQLYEKGLKSLSELQEKEYKTQEQIAKINVQENKLGNQKNELSNLYLELSAAEREYSEKLLKSISDQQSAVSEKMESIAATAKLQNQLSNYTERQKFYYITAPQSGFITKTIKKGLGETVKEGMDVATIVPDQYDLAVELYVKPQDIPLLRINSKAQLRFDGWPAIVISGWPKSSTGVFHGNIVAIEKYISDNGKYRVIISPNNDKKHWPQHLSIGTGVQAFLLLNEVPIWYEIWRLLNGFPANYYQKNDLNEDEIKRKSPIKSIK
ncbi:MAG: HlyD family efflux transporter periplasmic adaptor subunit [Chitinophagales bacterium]